MAVSLNILFEDAKGAKSITTFNLPDGLTNLSYSEMGVILVDAVKQLVTGKITGAQICFGIDLSSIAGITDAPASTSDVEEGARFIWNVAGGFTASNRIPTFDEALIVPNSRFVDLLDNDIITFIGAVTGNLTTTDDGPQAVVDYRDADILNLDSGRESFQRSRRVR